MNKEKDKLTNFCPTCNRDRKIISLERDRQGVVIKMSCGHSYINDEILNEVKICDFYQDNHFDNLGKKQARSGTKISVKTKRPTKELMTWNYETRVYRHIVWETDEEGNEVKVYDKPEPFRKKKKR
jgi:hypothetical protein